MCNKLRYINSALLQLHRQQGPPSVDHLSTNFSFREVLDMVHQQRLLSIIPFCFYTAHFSFRSSSVAKPLPDVMGFIAQKPH